MDIDRDQGKPGADADAIDPPDDPNPLHISSVVEPKRSGSAKKAVQQMVSKRPHGQDIDQHVPAVLIDSHDERIQVFLAVFIERDLAKL